MITSYPWQKLGAQALPSLLSFVLVILLATLSASSPLSLLSLLPLYALVYYWTLFLPAALPLWWIALLALLQDAIYGLALGSSLFCCLLLRVQTNWLRSRVQMRQFFMAWLFFLPVTLVLALLHAAIQSLLNEISAMTLLQHYALIFMVTWLCYPLCHLLCNACYRILPETIRPRDSGYHML